MKRPDPVREAASSLLAALIELYPCVDDDEGRFIDERVKALEAIAQARRAGIK